MVEEGILILQKVWQSEDMQKLWRNYQKKYSYAVDLGWDTVMDSVITLYSIVMDHYPRRG